MAVKKDENFNGSFLIHNGSYISYVGPMNVGVYNRGE